MKRLLLIMILFASGLSAQDCVIKVPTDAGDVMVGMDQVRYAIQRGSGSVLVRQGRASRVETTITVDSIVALCAGTMFKFTDERSGATHAISKAYVSSAQEHPDGTVVIVTSDPGVAFKTVETAIVLEPLITACGAGASPVASSIAVAAPLTNGNVQAELESIVTPRYNTIYISENGDDADALAGHPVYPYLTWNAAIAGRTSEDLFVDGSFTPTTTITGSINVESFPGASITQGSTANVFTVPNGGTLKITGKPTINTLQTNTAASFIGYSPGATNLNIELDLDVVNNVNNPLSTYSRAFTQSLFPAKNAAININTMNVHGASLDFNVQDGAALNANINEFNWAAIETGGFYSEYALTFRSLVDTTNNASIYGRIGKLNRNKYESLKGGAFSIGRDLYYYFNNANVVLELDEYNAPDSITGTLDEFAIQTIRGVYLNSTVKTIVRKARGYYRSVPYSDFDGNVNGKQYNSKFIFEFGDIESPISILAKRPSVLRDPWDLVNSQFLVNCEQCITTADNVIDIDFIDPLNSSNYLTKITGYYETKDITQSVIVANSNFTIEDATFIVADPSQPAISATIPITVTVRGCYYTNSTVTDPDITWVYETDCQPAAVDNYIADDLAAGTATYPVLTGDYTLQFGDNIDMNFDSVRYFLVKPRVNQGGKEFLARIGDANHLLDIYKDGLGTGYVQLKSPGGSITFREAATNVDFDLPASSTSNFVFTDSRTVKTGAPMIYAADYSANYTPRSLPDWGSVQNYVGTALNFDSLTSLTGAVAEADELFIRDDGPNEVKKITYGEFSKYRMTVEFSTNTTANPYGINLADVSTGILTVSPPAIPSKGMWFAVSDSRGNSGTFNITVDFVTATQNLHASSQNYIMNSNNAYVKFVYVDSTVGWIIAN